MRQFLRGAEDVLQLEVHHSVCDLWSLKSSWPVAATGRQKAMRRPRFWHLPCGRRCGSRASTPGQAAAPWWRDGRFVHARSLELPGRDWSEDLDTLASPIARELLMARQTARTHRATLFTVLLSVLHWVLQRWFRQDDVATGGAGR